MLDPKLLRNDLENIAGQLARRGMELDVQRITELETRRKTLQVDAQDLQSQRNSRSRRIGQAKAAGQLTRLARVLIDDQRWSAGHREHGDHRVAGVIIASINAPSATSVHHIVLPLFLGQVSALST